MATLPDRQTSASPPATTLVSITTTITSSSSSSKIPAEITSSTSPVEPTSSSPYFLPELIPLIASHLTRLQDFLALRAACRTYRAVLPPSPSNLASQAPLLLAPQNADLFHGPLRRLLLFFLPRYRVASCGSLSSFYSFGCRVAIHDRGALSRIRHVLHVRHLLTGEQARLPDPTQDFDGLVMSGDLVITSTRYSRLLRYCRIGDAHWQSARCDKGYQIYNLMFVKGILYALVSPDYCLAVVELQNSSATLSFLGDDLGALTVQYPMVWLAECDGELLLVVKVQCSPRVYHVFQWQSTARKWARTTNLGGFSLFFSRQQFAGCLGPDHPAVRRDCLFFISCSWKWSEYSLFDGSWHEHVVDYPGRAAMGYFGALAWVLPSIG